METHILVVEDDAEIREGVAIYLKNQGYTVHGAANGAQGLELARQLPIHLAVVDVMMPVMEDVYKRQSEAVPDGPPAQPRSYPRWSPPWHTSP